MANHPNRNAPKLYDTESAEDFNGELQALRAATRNCRPDMHEPDEADIEAVVYGKHLDNAGCGGEFMVHLYEDGKQVLAINLSTLIALARMAKIQVA